MKNKYADHSNIVVTEKGSEMLTSLKVQYIHIFPGEDVRDQSPCILHYNTSLGEWQVFFIKLNQIYEVSR